MEFFGSAIFPPLDTDDFEVRSHRSVDLALEGRDEGGALSTAWGSVAVSSAYT